MLPADVLRRHDAAAHHRGAPAPRRAAKRRSAQVYAANTLGAIVGVLLAVHVGLPLLGLKGSLIAGALVDVALGLALLAAARAARRGLPAPRRLRRSSSSRSRSASQLDANKMTAGVFRYGDLASLARGDSALHTQDGKTATVHLVRLPGRRSLRTNGKSDGSINLDGRRASAAPTRSPWCSLRALPLALKPEAKSAAVIGIGTGLTTHTLLQSLEIERVDTIEIEPAMAEASRGFAPRNGAAFADPRSTIVIDDAKSFFSTQRPPLRHHRLGALQSVGQRRREPFHARVLPARARRT